MIYLRVAHAKDTARSFTNMSLSLLKAIGLDDALDSFQGVDVRLKMKCRRRVENLKYAASQCNKTEFTEQRTKLVNDRDICPMPFDVGWRQNVGSESAKHGQ